MANYKRIIRHSLFTIHHSPFTIRHSPFTIMSNKNSNLKQQARKAALQYAFMRWESAVVIGGTLLLWFFSSDLFPTWPGWVWPALGGLALLMIVVSSVTDAKTNAQVQLDLFQEQFELRNILDPLLRREVEQALEYQRSIQAHTAKQRPGLLKERLEDTTHQIGNWVSNIYKLAVQLDMFRHDPLLMQERESVPRELETLTSRRHQENNVEVQQQLDEVISSKRKQLDSLRALEERMKQAELQLEQSNTALATIYSQAQLISTQDIRSGKSDRLRQDIQEQVAQLNDLVSSINEVYDYQGS